MPDDEDDYTLTTPNINIEGRGAQAAAASIDDILSDVGPAEGAKIAIVVGDGEEPDTLTINADGVSAAEMLISILREYENVRRFRVRGVRLKYTEADLSGDEDGDDE